MSVNCNLIQRSFDSEQRMAPLDAPVSERGEAGSRGSIDVSQAGEEPISPLLPTPLAQTSLAEYALQSEVESNLRPPLSADEMLMDYL